MKRILLLLLLLAGLAMSVAGARAAVLQSFDQVFAGDDPTEGFTFALAYDPATPTWLQFDGFAENLAFDETGVRFLLRWGTAGAEVGGELAFPGAPDFGGVRLPGTAGTPVITRVPIQFGVAIDYAPGGVLLVVEGLGPSDNFRFVGDLTIQPVPEPSSWVLLAGGAALAGVAFLRRGARNLPRLS